MEDKGGEGSMEETFIKTLHQMVWCLSHFCKDRQQLSSTKKVVDATAYRSILVSSGTKWVVVFINNNGPVAHGFYLLTFIDTDIDGGQCPGVSRCN